MSDHKDNNAQLHKRAGPDAAGSSATTTTTTSTSAHEQHRALLEAVPQTGLKCDVLFLVIKNRIQEEQEYVRKLRVVFQFNITKNGEHAATWTCDTRTSLEGDIYRDKPREGLKPDCVLTVDDDDWVKIMVGKLNPQRAFMMSKFKIKGNIMLLQKLHSLWFDLRRKGKTPELDLIQEIMVEEPLLPGVKSEVMAVEIVQRIVRMPHLAQVNSNIQINILKEGRLVTKYMVSLHANRKPEFRRLYNGLLEPHKQRASPQSAPQPDVTLTIEDDDLVLLVYGVHKLRAAVESGMLRVEGDARVVERIQGLFELAPIMARL